MKLRTSAFTVLALGALLGPATVTRAQVSVTRLQATREAHEGEGPMAKLSEALDLTKEQREEVRPIVREQLRAVRSIREDTNLSEQQKREQMKAAREKFIAAMDAVLTPEQQEKLARLLHLQRERREHHEGGDTGGGTTTPTGTTTTPTGTTPAGTTTTPANATGGDTTTGNAN